MTLDVSECSRLLIPRRSCGPRMISAQDCTRAHRPSRPALSAALVAFREIG